MAEKEREMSFVEAASQASRILTWMQCLTRAKDVLTVAYQAQDHTGRMRKEGVALGERIKQLETNLERSKQIAVEEGVKRKEAADEQVQTLANEITRLRESVAEARAQAEKELGELSKMLAERKKDNKQLLEKLDQERQASLDRLSRVKSELAALKEKL